MARIDAEGGAWHDRALADPAFARRVRLAYEGPHDALDALWWYAHPMTAAPSGRVSPAARLPELQRVVYSTRGRNRAELVSLAAATTRLGELQAELDADRRAVESAVRQALAGSEDRPAAVQSEEPPVLAEVAEVAELAEPTGEPTRSIRPPSRRRLRLIVVGAVAAALVVGFVVGSQVPMAQSWGDARGATAPASPAPLTYIQAATGEIGPSPYAVFDREADALDRPAEALPDSFEADTFRRLSAAQNGIGAVYAARNGSEQVCVVIIGFNHDWGASCGSATSFPVDGMSVTLTTQTTEEDLASGTGKIKLVDLDTTWYPDGRVVSHSADHASLIPSPASPRPAPPPY